MNNAEVAELADALRSGRSDPCGHVGSTPTFGTLIPRDCSGDFFVSKPSGKPQNSPILEGNWFDRVILV
jgi:hypothetical protein